MAPSAAAPPSEARHDDHVSRGQPPPAGCLRQPPHLGPAGGEAHAQSVHGRRQSLHRIRDVLLHRDRRRGGSARLFVQGRHARFRARHRALATRVSRFRRQRHVQEPRQPAGQSERRFAVHRYAEAAPAARQRHRHGEPRRSTPRPNRGRADHRAGERARDFSQLPALHPAVHARGAVDLRPPPGRRFPRAEVEGVRRLQGLHPPAPADVPPAAQNLTVVSSTVTLPTWLVAILAALALWSVLERLLLPSVRWLLRRRINRAIDELNTRLKLRIQPLKLAKRAALIDQLVFDPDVLRAIADYAAENGVPREMAQARARRYAREIVPSFSHYAYFGVGTRVARFVATYLYRVRLGYLDEKALQPVDPDAAVVFVINHRSNMDYVLVTYMVAQSSALSYAVGEWARVWVLQSLIRAMGAYFIRRDSRDPLYRKVLARYVQIATAEGVTQAVFPEGGLSRDGALRSPKFGLLSYMVARFDPEGERDVVFVPVGINYDRVLEDRNLTAGLASAAGAPYRKRGGLALSRYLARAFARAAAGRWHRNGYAAVSFGTPVSLRAYARERNLDFRRLAEEQRFSEVEALGTMLMRQGGKD